MRKNLYVLLSALLAVSCAFAQQITREPRQLRQPTEVRLVEDFKDVVGFGCTKSSHLFPPSISITMKVGFVYQDGSTKEEDVRESPTSAKLMVFHSFSEAELVCGKWEEETARKWIYAIEYQRNTVKAK